MNAKMVTDLLQRLARVETKPDVRKGVVSAVGPLAVQLGGSATPYTAVETVNDDPLAIGDIVSALFYGKALLVLGRVSTPAIWHTIGAVGEPAFQNGWVNFGGGEQVAQFRKVNDQVFARGMVKNGTVNTAIFSLPAVPNHRPPATVRRPGIANGAFAYVSVTTGGDVSSAGSNAWLDLSSVTFAVT